MAWADSRVFDRYVSDALDRTTLMDLDTDASIKVALYNNTTAPDRTVAAANSAYAVAQWVVGNEVTDATGWPAGGRPLVTYDITIPVGGAIMFDAADTASANSTTTLTANFGCLVYDDTIAAPVADQGVCFNYFGGSQTITSGLYTIVWHANGIWRATT